MAKRGPAKRNPTKLDEAMEQRGYLTMRAARALLGVSTPTMYRMADEKRVQVVVSAGKKYVSRASCKDYLGAVGASAMGIR